MCSCMRSGVERCAMPRRCSDYVPGDPRMACDSGVHHHVCGSRHKCSNPRRCSFKCSQTFLTRSSVSLANHTSGQGQGRALTNIACRSHPCHSHRSFTSCGSESLRCALLPQRPLLTCTIAFIFSGRKSDFPSPLMHLLGMVKKDIECSAHGDGADVSSIDACATHICDIVSLESGISCNRDVVLSNVAHICPHIFEPSKLVCYIFLLSRRANDILGDHGSTWLRHKLVRALLRLPGPALGDDPDATALLQDPCQNKHTICGHYSNIESVTYECVAWFPHSASL
jgi:hypothetical protein